MPSRYGRELSRAIRRVQSTKRGEMNMQYPAVFYYEWYSVRKWCFVKKRKFLIHVCFPDLIAVGLPASTGGKNRKIAVERAKDIF